MRAPADLAVATCVCSPIAGAARTGALTAAGWTVVSVDLRAAGAGAPDPPAASLQADVGDPAVWPSLVARVEGECGGVDAMHLNAGMLTGEGRVEQLSDDRYRQVMRLNVDQVVYGLRAAVPPCGGAAAATSSSPHRSPASCPSTRTPSTR